MEKIEINEEEDFILNIVAKHLNQSKKRTRGFIKSGGVIVDNNRITDPLFFATDKMIIKFKNKIITIS